MTLYRHTIGRRVNLCEKEKKLSDVVQVRREGGRKRKSHSVLEGGLHPKFSREEGKTFIVWGGKGKRKIHYIIHSKGH